jgi:hypothetical protein
MREINKTDHHRSYFIIFQHLVKKVISLHRILDLGYDFGGGGKSPLLVKYSECKKVRLSV